MSTPASRRPIASTLLVLLAAAVVSGVVAGVVARNQAGTSKAPPRAAAPEVAPPTPRAAVPPEAAPPTAASSPTATPPAEPASPPTPETSGAGSSTAPASHVHALVVGTPLQGTLGGKGPHHVDYRLEIPKDSVYLRVSLEDRSGRIDLDVALTQDDLENADWYDSGYEDVKGRTFEILRDDEEAFDHAAIYLRLTIGAGQGRPLPYRLSALARKPSVDGVLRPGHPWKGILGPATGYRRVFEVNVPQDADALRVDLGDVRQDLDLYASWDTVPLDTSKSTYSETSFIGAESLVIDGSSVPPLRPGAPLYVTVEDNGMDTRSVSFGITVSKGRDPPEAYARLPEIPRPEDPTSRAIASTVELLLGDFAGSGTLVRPDGLILTAAHVVSGAESAPGSVVVAMTLDPSALSRELFRADVVVRDDLLDVALLRIVSTFYRRPLPVGLVFPYSRVALDHVPKIGETLTTVGFPEPGGAGRRAPVTWSRGVLCGFDRGDACLRWKTDAFVASGSSGGPALDTSDEVVAVVVSNITGSEGAAHLGYLVPVSALPPSWQQRIERR